MSKQLFELGDEGIEQKYNKILVEFNEYKQQVLVEKQSQAKQLQRYKSQIDKLYKQMEKKFENKLQQQRVAHQKKVKKMETLMKQKEQEFNQIIENKNKFIEELKKRLIQNQQQKFDIIQNNTRMLYQLCEDMESDELMRGPTEHSYQDLLKLYHFVLQENNNLKKQLFKVENKPREVHEENSNTNTNTQINTSKTTNGRGEKKKKIGVPVENPRSIASENVRHKLSQVKKQAKKY